MQIVVAASGTLEALHFHLLDFPSTRPSVLYAEGPRYFPKLRVLRLKCKMIEADACMGEIVQASPNLLLLDIELYGCENPADRLKTILNGAAPSFKEQSSLKPSLRDPVDLKSACHTVESICLIDQPYPSWDSTAEDYKHLIISLDNPLTRESRGGDRPLELLREPTSLAGGPAIYLGGCDEWDLQTWPVIPSERRIKWYVKYRPRINFSYNIQAPWAIIMPELQECLDRLSALIRDKVLTLDKGSHTWMLQGDGSL